MDTPVTLTVPARGFLHGALEVDELGEGWGRPQRFTAAQREAASQCRYWKSSVFVQMTQCTAGVSIQFRTNAVRCAVECSMDDFPSGSRAVISEARRAMGEDFPQVCDGFSVEIDGVRQGVFMPSHDNRIVIDMSALPADTLHTLRVFFPCLTGGSVGGIELCGQSDNLQVDSVGSGERPLMVVCGDSLSQGFCTFDSARTYPQILADLLDVELVNHGIGGHVFQADMLHALRLHGSYSHRVPEIVLVEYGANYRYWACSEEEVRRDIEEYFSTLMKLWGQARVYVMTHMPHSEARYATHSESCYGRVPALISEIAGGYENVQLIDGREIIPLHLPMIADPEHLNAKGNEHLAQSLYEIITNS